MSVPVVDLGQALVYKGDCNVVLEEFEDDIFDSVVCDPPYHLTALTKRFGKEGSAPAKGPAFQRHNVGFMGQAWDGGDVAFQKETWEHVLRVLKPGGHLIAFSGTRTYHRMVYAIEDAGFEIRDMITWLYGQGFPKSLDMSKAIDKTAGHWRAKAGPLISSNGSMSGGNYMRSDKAPPVTAAAAWEGWGTALKPAMEPIVLARKPCAEKTVAANVVEYGTGAINVDGCRISAESYTINCFSTEGLRIRTHALPSENTGRWPANVVLAHDPECVEVGVQSDSYSINRFTDGAKPFGEGAGHEYESSEQSLAVPVWACVPTCAIRLLDTQTGTLTSGASRFFYCAKASTKERNAGLDNLEAEFAPTMGNGIGGKEHDPETATKKANIHPTVKPLALMRWLVRLVTPPSGCVLDPFAGSGSTLIAAMQEGFDSVGIELDEKGKYIPIISARFRYWAEKNEQDAA